MVLAKIMTNYDDILNHSFWGHRIRLGDGRYTPGTKDPEHWDAVGLPDEVDDKSVIDIGAFNGMHSFEAERRGAGRVLATDVWDTTISKGQTWRTLSGKAGFDLARDYLDSDVESEVIGVEDVSPATVGTFDVSMCLAVLYLLDDRRGAVRNLVDITEELVVIESGVDPRRFTDRLTGTSSRDPFTSRDLVAMLREAGCSRVRSFPLGERPTTRYTPPVRRAWIPPGSTTVYGEYGLSEPVDEVDGDPLVRVLFEADSSYRIQYGEQGSRRQGWVSADALRLYPDGAGGLARVFANTAWLRGPDVALDDAIQFFRPRLPPKSVGRVVVHGYL